MTAYNDSKMLLASVGCREAPPLKFADSPPCTASDKFCDKACKMPVPRNCDPDAKSYGTCEPAVRAVCENIGAAHESCAAMREHVASKENAYDVLDPGSPPCRTEADAPSPRARADEVRGAYIDWVDSVNDATRCAPSVTRCGCTTSVCTRRTTRRWCRRSTISRRSAITRPAASRSLTSTPAVAEASQSHGALTRGGADP